MLKKFAIMCFGSTFIGIGINGFILPFHLLNGGIFGISLLLNYVYGFHISLIVLILNIPIYLLALKSDPIYFFNGMMGALVSSVLIEWLVPLNGLFHLPILWSVLMGGVCIGIGAGCLLRNHISPGGMDLLALLISKWTRFNVGLIIYFIDTAIIVTGLFILQDVNLLYSVIIVMITGLFISLFTSIRAAHFYIE